MKLVYTVAVGVEYVAMARDMFRTLFASGYDDAAVCYTESGEEKIYGVDVKKLKDCVDDEWRKYSPLLLRYFIDGDADFGGADTVMYLDADCLVTGPLNDLFHQANQGVGVMAFGERRLASCTDVELAHFSEIPTNEDQPDVGWSTAVLVGASPDMESMKDKMWIALSERGFPQNDQPVFNTLKNDGEFGLLSLPRNFAHFFVSDDALSVHEELRIIHVKRHLRETHAVMANLICS